MVTKILRAITRPERLYYVLGEGSNAITLLLFVVVARLIPLEDYGMFMAIMATGNIVAYLGQLGFPDLVHRSMARDRITAKQEFYTGIRLQFMGMPLVLLLIYLYIRQAGFQERHIVAGLILGAAMALLTVKGTLRSAFQGAERFDLDAASNWVERGGTLLLAVVLCSTVLPHLGGVAVSYLGARLVHLGIFLVIIARLFPVGAGQIESSRTIMHRALPFAATGLLWACYHQIDLAMLPLLNSQEETALYGGAYRFVDLFLLVPRLLLVVDYPRQVAAWHKGSDEFAHIEQRLRALLLAAVFPVLFILSAAASPLMTNVFGSGFSGADQTLSILMFGCFFAAQSHLNIQLLKATGGERMLTVLYAATVAGNIALNWLLIPQYGAVGAATATATTEVLFSIMLALAVQYHLQRRLQLPNLVLLVGAACLGFSAFGGAYVTVPVACTLFAAGWIPALVRLGRNFGDSERSSAGRSP